MPSSEATLRVSRHRKSRPFDRPAARATRGERAQSGFTLIELLVVIVIIGIMATFAVLSVGDRALDDRLDNEARRLQQLLMLASEEAEVKGLELGFQVTQSGYNFLGLGTSGWAPLEGNDLLRARRIEPPFYVELRVDGRVVPPAREAEPGDKDDADKNEAKPQVYLLSSGERSSFLLDVRARDHRSYYRVRGDALGRITIERLEDKA